MTFAKKYGPWALIAGASEGTGRAFAQQVAAQGVNCILVARREGPLEALAAELAETCGVETLAVAADLSSADAADVVEGAIGEREVGLFINNAGADTVNALFLDADEAAWNGLVNLNVKTMLGLCHRLGQPMRERGHGGILLVGSGACYGGASYLAAYSGSKAFTLCFAEGLWAEMRPHGVDVLHLVLGQTDTPAFRESLARKGTPVPDNLADPAEVAALGLERLPHGPLQNWGQGDDQAGMATDSAAARRERVRLIDRAMRAMFGS